MKNYLQLAPKYLSTHKKRTWLAMMSVIISVALVVGITSILDSLLSFERQHVLHSVGNFHLLVKDATNDEIQLIQSRFDVANSGTLKNFHDGTINGKRCQIVALDENFMGNLNLKLLAGSYPDAANEIMLDTGYAKEAGLKIGDAVSVTPYQNTVQKYILSGIFENENNSEKDDIPCVFLSMKNAASLTPEKSSFFIQFKDGIRINQAVEKIQSVSQIPQKRIVRNEALLALMMQSKHNRVLPYYGIGAFLFLMILITAVIMIYNTFHISVLERVRQYGLLRCIGTSKQQIKRLVRREGLLIALISIPLGLAAGVLMSVICLLILRILSSSIYGTISLFHFSPIALLSGIILGSLTIFLALLSPAKKASSVSPVNALSGNNDLKPSRKRKQGILSKLLPVEVALGIENAYGKKKTMLLMSCSIAFSIILFLLFASLINPDITGVKPIQPYTPDVRISCDKGINPDIYDRLTKIQGIKRVYGRMNTLIKASFDAASLTSYYKNASRQNKINTTDKNFIENPENSFLLSYDKTQFEFAKNYITSGKAEEDNLNKNNGIIAVNKVYYHNVLTLTNTLKVGDKVAIKTEHGIKEFTVSAVANALPYAPNGSILAAFIVTEKQFKEISSQNKYKVIDVQLTKNNQDNTIAEINKLSGKGLEIVDRREGNRNNANIYLTVCVFIYGFVCVIAFISILNIVNTMHTSITAKTKRIGVMRAIGMSGSQITRMVIAEASAFCATGCIIGCILGVILQKTFSNIMLIQWHFPGLQLILIFIVSFLASIMSVQTPLKQLREKGVSEVINAM